MSGGIWHCDRCPTEKYGLNRPDGWWFLSQAGMGQTYIVCKVECGVGLLESLKGRDALAVAS